MKAPSRQFRWADKLALEPAGFAHGWALLPVSLVFALCFCAMTAPWLSGRYTIPWDAKAHFQPQIQFLADCIARGEWPFWNPYVFSGQPQIADPQSMIFSPPFLLLALVNRSPSLWAVDFTLLLSMFAGGVAFIAWIRDRGWHWAGALLAAIAFSFGAAMAWRIQHIGHEKRQQQRRMQRAPPGADVVDLRPIGAGRQQDREQHGDDDKSEARHASNAE